MVKKICHTQSCQFLDFARLESINQWKRVHCGKLSVLAHHITKKFGSDKLMCWKFNKTTFSWWWAMAMLKVFVYQGG